MKMNKLATVIVLLFTPLLIAGIIQSGRADEPTAREFAESEELKNKPIIKFNFFWSNDSACMIDSAILEREGFLASVIFDHDAAPTIETMNDQYLLVCETGYRKNRLLAIWHDQHNFYTADTSPYWEKEALHGRDVRRIKSFQVDGDQLIIKANYTLGFDDSFKSDNTYQASRQYRADVTPLVNWLNRKENHRVIRDREMLLSEDVPTSNSAYEKK